MRLIHCADLHLDSALETRFTPEQAARRRRELLTSFGKMVDFAAGQQVQAVLIAGDLFDREPVHSETRQYVLNRIRANPQILFFYLAGNHDPDAIPEEECPENLKRFSSRWKTYFYEDVAISGIELTAENAYSFYDSLPQPRFRDGRVPFHIVLLHGQLAEREGEGMIRKARLKDRGIHYLALGHLHRFRQETLDAFGIACYCGCPEGRGFDECGKKGFVLLDTENGTPEIQFYSCALRQLWEVPVEISGMEQAGEIEEEMEEALAEIPEKDMVRVILTGEYPESCVKTPTLWQMRFAERFAYFELVDQSRLMIRIQDYASDASVRGEFVRSVLQSDLAEEDRERILQLGLRALEGELPDEPLDGIGEREKF